MKKLPTVIDATKPMVSVSPIAIRSRNDSVMEVSRDSVTIRMPSRRSRTRAPSTSSILSSLLRSRGSQPAKRAAQPDLVGLGRQERADRGGVHRRDRDLEDDDHEPAPADALEVGADRDQAGVADREDERNDAEPQ